MSTIEKSITVDVPVRTAYDQWTEFEEFPRFMEGVEEVRQVTDTTLEWKARIGGIERSWSARITEQEPDRRIAWVATEGVNQAGTVAFEPVDGDQTRLTLLMDIEPEDWAEKAGDALGIVERRVEGDLERFKRFIEARGVETGAWRGSVPPDAGTDVSPTGTGPA